MANNLQLSTAARAGLLDAIETAGGATAKMKIFSAAQPTSCSAADPAGALAAFTLPTDWMSGASAAGNVVTKVFITGAGWTTTASAAGTAASFRIYANDGTTCHVQGTCGATTGYDLNFDNPVLATSQTVTISGFTLTAPNA